MRSPVPGQLLLDLIGGARKELVLCAPFVKQRVVERLIQELRPDVELTLYTRWRPEEVAAGVSDTEVLSVVQEFGGKVYLSQKLHAKYFRTESDLLLGSANLTATALGWSACPNLELLVAGKLEDVTWLETLLKGHAVEATAELAAQVQAVADLIGEGATAEPTLDLTAGQRVNQNWLPRLRHPGDLFIAYTKGAHTLTTKSGGDAADDLFFLDLPSGLKAESFGLVVGDRLLQNPFFRNLDSFLDQRRRFGEIKRFVKEHALPESTDATQSTQTVMRWLLEFLPERYETIAPNWSESLQKRNIAQGL